MSKAVIVIDMPECCGHCPVSYFTEGAHHDFCQLLGYETTITEEGKLAECPLKPLPEKKNIKTAATPTEIGCRKGWNDCIETILKEES